MNRGVATATRLLLTLGFALPGTVGGALLGARLYFAFGSSNRDNLAPALFALAAGAVGAAAGGVAAGLSGQGLRRSLGALQSSLFRGIAAVIANAALWAGMHLLAMQGIDSIAARRNNPAPSTKPAVTTRTNPCDLDPQVLSERERRIWDSECR